MQRKILLPPRKVLCIIVHYILGAQSWGAGKFFRGSGSLFFFQAAPAPASYIFLSGSGSCVVLRLRLLNYFFLKQIKITIV